MPILSFLLWLLWAAHPTYVSSLTSEGTKPLVIYYACIGAIFAAIVLRFGPLDGARIKRRAIWIALYLCWMGISIFWTDAPNVLFVFATWCTFALYCGAVLLTMSAPNPMSNARAALWGIIVGCCVDSAYLLAFGDIAGANPGENDLMHRNGMGGYAGFGVVAVFYFIISSKGPQRILAMLLIMPMAGSLVAATSKTAMVAAAVGCLVLLALQKSSPRAKAVAVAPLIAAIMVALPFAADHLTSYLNNADPETLTGRTAIWMIFVGMIKEAPVVGHGFMWIAFHPPYSFAAQAHNEILQQLLEGGVIALILAVLVYVTATRSLVRGKGEFMAVGLALIVYCIIRGIAEAADTTVLPLEFALLLIYAARIPSRVGPLGERVNS